MSNDPGNLNVLGILMLLGLVLWAMIALLVLKRAGVFRARTILGPDRIGQSEHPIILAALILAAFVAGILGSTTAVYVVPTGTQWRPYVATIAFSVAATAIMLAGNALLRRDGLRLLGLTAEQIPQGLRAGAKGGIAIIPLVLLVGVVVMTTYTLLGWPQPEAHDLLKTLGLSEGIGSKLLLIIMAVLIAPLFEELLFRGLLQTLIVRLIAGRLRESQPVMAEAVPVGTAAGEPTTLSYAGPFDPAGQPAQPEQRIGRMVFARWAGVLIASMIFAAVHGEPAFVPSLFILAVGIGFAYEATGNLWVPITIHGLFNAFQITLFVAGLASPDAAS